ncbi:MAG: hypothetical protein GY793_07045 [Proteobacteria bacterium]|nr:hypothetical protein [Pseudomonadota bacterium]
MGLSIKQGVVCLATLAVVFTSNASVGEFRPKKKSNFNKDENYCNTLTKAEIENACELAKEYTLKSASKDYFNIPDEGMGSEEQRRDIIDELLDKVEIYQKRCDCLEY